MTEKSDESGSAGSVSDCFVIAPIGQEGSDSRRGAETIYKNLIEPCCVKLQLAVTRAHEISSPGLITNQILEFLRDSKVVIADLSELNPNVFYELAFRHSLGRPVVLLKPIETDLPFDVANSRAVEFDPRDWSSLGSAMEQLEKQLKQSLSDPSATSQNPITAFAALSDMRTKDDPISQTLVRVNAFLETLDGRLHVIEHAPGAEWRTNAEFIDGQDDAFQALTQATAQAKFAVRSSRFFPASIMSRPDYLQAIEERVRGSESRPAVHEYRRIIALNNMDKKQDVIQHIVNFAGRPFKLFLTSHENSFELVVIDDTDVFIHFAKAELVIASSLHLHGRRIAQRFIDVFDQLATRDIEAEFDCANITPVSLSGELSRVDAIFEDVLGGGRAERQKGSGQGRKQRGPASSVSGSTAV